MQRSDLMHLPSHWQKLNIEFYQRSNVLLIAKQLLGKILVTQFNQELTAARIVETEAYNGIIDKASHAYNNKRTKRTEVMFLNGGTAYVYLCYGIHYLFNVVTNKQDIPHAVLIRAAEPLIGASYMLARTNKSKLDFSITRGPGKVSKALGIQISHNNSSLLSEEVFIVDDGYKLPNKKIVATPRIGVDYAGKDALLPYRFFIKDCAYVSGKK
jgi:DNA-3-methyladenine glycosylase